VRFRQKPMLDLVVCVGHYPFTKEAVEQYFPERGTFKIAALPRNSSDLLLARADNIDS